MYNIPFDKTAHLFDGAIFGENLVNQVEINGVYDIGDRYKKNTP